MGVVCDEVDSIDAHVRKRQFLRQHAVADAHEHAGQQVDAVVGAVDEGGAAPTGGRARRAQQGSAGRGEYVERDRATRLEPAG